MNGKILAALAVVIVIAVAAAAILLNNNGDGGEDSGSDPALKTEFAVGDYYELTIDFESGDIIPRTIDRYEVVNVSSDGTLTVEYTETVDSVEENRETLYCTYREFLDPVTTDTANKVDRGYEVIDTYLGELNCHVWGEDTEGTEAKVWIYDGISVLSSFYMTFEGLMVEGTMELTAGTIFE